MALCDGETQTVLCKTMPPPNVQTQRDCLSRGHLLIQHDPGGRSPALYHARLNGTQAGQKAVCASIYGSMCWHRSALQSLVSVGQRDLLDADQIGSSAQIWHIGAPPPHLRHIIICTAHRVIEAGAHQLYFTGAFQIFLFKIRGELPIDVAGFTQPLQLIDNKLIARFLAAALHAAKANMA